MSIWEGISSLYIEPPWEPSSTFHYLCTLVELKWNSTVNWYWTVIFCHLGAEIEQEEINRVALNQISERLGINLFIQIFFCVKDYVLYFLNSKVLHIDMEPLQPVIAFAESCEKRLHFHLHCQLNPYAYEHQHWLLFEEVMLPHDCFEGIVMKGASLARLWENGENAVVSALLCRMMNEYNNVLLLTE